MLYAKIVSSVVLIYPYTLGELQADHPNTSFPEDMTPTFLATYDVYEVLPTIQPAYNPATQKVVEVTPMFNGSVWQQTWSVVALTAPEQQAYKLQFIDQAKAAMVQYLDTFASTRDYQTCDSCCGYMGTSSAQLDGDATYMFSARDTVVASGYATLAQIKIGAVPVPSMSAFIASLPTLAWPNPELWPAVDGMAVL
jgi:hypothetical protein